MNGIEYIASILKLEGVELMPCYPSNPLIEEVTKVGIRPVPKARWAASPRLMRTT